MAVVSLRLYSTPMIELSQISLLNRGKVLGYILQPLHELTTQRLTLLITNVLSKPHTTGGNMEADPLLDGYPEIDKPSCQLLGPTALVSISSTRCHNAPHFL